MSARTKAQAQPPKEVRLNIGSGTHYDPAWTCIDKYATKVDYRLDLFDLAATFGPVAQQVYLGHVLEHLPWERTAEALEQIRKVMRPGGELCVVGPCILRAVQTRQPLHIFEAILSDPRQPTDGHGHAWTPTEELTLEAVRQVFPDAYTVSVSHVRRPEWPNPDSSLWQCAIRATA